MLAIFKNTPNQVESAIKSAGIDRTRVYLGNYRQDKTVQVTSTDANIQRLLLTKLQVILID